MPEKTIPILPCRTLQPVLDFYTALGFEVTYQQRSPNPYAVVQRGGIEQS
jgi:predicted lactoylglutathione lyase